MKLVLSITSLFLLILPFHLMAETANNRAAIKIPEKFRPLMMVEMRKNLETVQGIVDALAKEDFKRVEKLASALGRMEHSAEVMQRRQLIPDGYRALGPPMHLGFQAIARDTRDFGDV